MVHLIEETMVIASVALKLDLDGKFLQYIPDPLNVIALI